MRDDGVAAERTRAPRRAARSDAAEAAQSSRQVRNQGAADAEPHAPASAGGAGSAAERRSSHLERIGVLWSSLSVLHCGVPLLATALPLVTGAHAHEHAGHRHEGSLQLPLVLGSVLIAALVVGRSYFARHRDWRPLALLALGVAVLGAGQFSTSTAPGAAMAATAAGLVAILAAQITNVLLLRRAGACCAAEGAVATPSA